MLHILFIPKLSNKILGNNRCPEPESNQRHEDFQSSALPTELSGHWVAGIGFEPMTFGLWARRASRLLHPALSYLVLLFSEWTEVDSNHRSKMQQIYSLSPLASRESVHRNYSVSKADDRTRTDNLLITNQLLCQLSHIGIFSKSWFVISLLCLQ